MSSDLTYLARLIQLIDKEGNDESKKKLWSLVSIKAMDELKSFTEKDASHFINAVHELNIEQHVTIQSKDFYKHFPFAKFGIDETLKNQMISDFIAMEHCRRRDDFQGFSMSAFQQIEFITNYLMEKADIWERANANKDTWMFTSRTKDGIGGRFGYTLGNKIIYIKKSEDRAAVLENFFRNRKADFLSKFRMVLYFGYFNELVRSEEEWDQIYNLGVKLYQARNSNHRGTLNNDFQEEIAKDLENNKYMYYLVFQGFLADFINKIGDFGKVIKLGS